MKIPTNTDSTISTIYLHSIEPEKIPDNFEFISIKDFLKKKKIKNYDIFIGDLLEYFSADASIEILNHIVSKLNIGKKLCIQGIDVKSICNSFSMDEINETVFNIFIYGVGKKQSVSFYKIKNIIDSINTLEIVSIKFMNSINYYIECVKK